MENEEEIKCSIKCSEGNRIITFKITEQCLIEEWRSGLESGRRYWDLKNLFPIIDYYQGCSSQFERYVIYTISVLASLFVYSFLQLTYIFLYWPHFWEQPVFSFCTKRLIMENSENGQYLKTRMAAQQLT